MIVCVGLTVEINFWVKGIEFESFVGLSLKFVFLKLKLHYIHEFGGKNDKYSYEILQNTHNIVRSLFKQFYNNLSRSTSTGYYIMIRRVAIIGDVHNKFLKEKK